MPMTRSLLLLCCMLLPYAAQAALPSARKPGGGNGGGGIQCPLRPAECQVNAPVFNFGRGEMSSSAAPVNATATISVTCTRAPIDNLSVTVEFELQALPIEPGRVMRHRFEGDWDYLRYNMFVDASHLRFWGDGSAGTATLQGTLTLDDRNRVGTLAFPIFGRVEGAQPLILPGQWLGAVVTRVRYIPVCH